MLIVLGWPVQAQTYNVGPGGSAKPQTQPDQTKTPGQSLGFGTNIQNARLARSAELALERGDHALAVDYAQRAAQATPNDPQLWFLLGYAARLDGKFPLAASAYTRGLRLSPSSLDGLSGLGQTYSLMGRTDEAERILKQVFAADPRRADAALLLGDLSMRSGDYATALDWLSRAERIQPGARSELLLAVSYQHLKEMDLANHYLELAKRRAPNDPDVQRSFAGYYRETGNYPQAIAALKSIHNPKPDVTAELAYTYQLDGKLDDSAQLYTQAANALPRDLGLQLSAAQAEVSAGSIENADSFLRRASTLNADSYRLHSIRGEIAQLQDHDGDAIEEYRAALAHLPASPIEGPLYGIQVRMNLVALYKDTNDESAAEQQLKAAQTEIGALDERGPDRAQFLRLRASIRMNAGELDGAMSDIKEALALSPRDPNSLQLDGDLLIKLGHTEEAIAVYKRVLAMDPRSRFALTSLGYASRAAGRDQDAEKYFDRLEQLYPSLYVPYLALGDMYTSHREFKRAQASYTKGYGLAPDNALMVAGGANAAIEAHDFDLAGKWLGRATPVMEQEPQILREKERYLSFVGDSRQSAEIGRQAIKVLPRDRDVVVYLGYDLLRLEQYNELLALTDKYMDVFPKEPDIPLLAGYVYKHNDQLDQALKEFTEVLKRDPNVTTAYVNRGYVLNDLHQPEEAAADFGEALKREPKNGEAHLGLAFSELELNHLQTAVRQTQLAEAALGDSKALHTIRATAYGREGLLSRAAAEYRAALKFTPQDGSLYVSLANISFAERRYHEVVDELQIAQKLSPNDPALYALFARTYAYLQEREQALHYIQLAEEHAEQTPAAANASAGGNSELSATFVATGEALSTLGDQRAAMERFQKALTAPNSNRIDVRLAIAQLMTEQERPEDAERQIALAQMEAEAGETARPTGDQYIEAANLFQEMHEYQLAQSYLERAKAAGASDISVRIGMANDYLALGDTRRAAAELAAVNNVDESESDYQYLLAQANVYEQEHQATQALSAFAQAASAAGEDQTAEQGLLQAGANEGLRINPRVSLLTNVLVQPIFEDSTVYVLDSKLLGPAPVPSSNLAQLPPPRSSLETDWTTAYHLHLGKLPAPGGFFQIRNARGLISVPATNSIVNRDTTDVTLNFGLNPTIHLGTNVLTFNTGIQGTIRRDSLSPMAMNQNLFRVFTYMTTSSFFNVLSVDGYFIRETGPFTESNIYSRTLTGAIDFRVGAPWGKTALVTGWGSNDQQFTTVATENYYTSSYIGLVRRFGTRWSVEGLAEDLRDWRVVGPRSGIAQALRPAGTLDFSLTPNWHFEASTAYENTRGFHVYDMTQNGFAMSYTRPFGRTFNDETGEVHLKYPIRLSAGVQEETFPNFTVGQNQQFKPYVSITLF